MTAINHEITPSGRRKVSMIQPLPFAFIAILLLAGVLLFATSCGKTGITQDQYNQVQKGMTLDEVEGVLGQPDRTHRTGPTKNPNIIWYYNKSEGEGLVRISFLDGKVDSTSPYEVDVNPDE